MKIPFHKSRSTLLVASAALVLFSLGAHRAKGAGLLVADGGFGGQLEIREHTVEVTINNGVAVTKVKQSFQNMENRQVEALYTFPVPKGASVANFSMWINGKEMVGEVVEKKRAREIYNSYKRVRRDPGLLEQKDYKTFEMRIFPIAAKAIQRVEISYYQELEIDNNWATYVYPLATVAGSDTDSSVKGKFAINADVRSEIPITHFESPSHNSDFAIAMHGDGYVQASLEAESGSLARDIVLAYELKRPRTGIDVISSRAGREDGFFQLTLSAGEDLAKFDEGMDYVFVLDVSGSMANDGKLLVSKESVEAFLNELSEKDRFEVITFNVSPSTAFGSLVLADAPRRARAIEFLKNKRAKGGTVLKPALDVAYRYADSDRPLNVVILSDGMTEQRERAALLASIQRRPRSVRVFCIGVGNEVNRPLLEQIAEDSGGLAAFASRGDDFERQAKAFRRKLMRPVLADVTLKFEGREVYDLVPERLPNLYHGMPIRVYGRYRGEGKVKATLSGTVQGQASSRSAELNFPLRDKDNPEIERMWAWHRVDELQKAADRKGSRTDVIDDIVMLGEAYSIVTEYTSFLVLENDREYQRWKIKRRNALRINRDREAQLRLRNELETMRDQAAANIGPLGPRPVQVAKRIVKKAKPVQRAPQSTSTPRRTSRSRSIDFDFGAGSGPVGPILLAAAGWLTRRKKRHA